MAMDRIVGSAAVSEQLIGALVPASVPRPRASAVAMPVLATRRRPIGAEFPVLDTAWLDRSGRLSARDLMRVLGWAPGRRVSIDVVGDAVLVVSAAGGRDAVGGRGGLVLPAAVRQLCGIDSCRPVLLAAYVSGIVVVHSIEAVARLVAGLHSGLVAGQGGG